MDNKPTSPEDCKKRSVLVNDLVNKKDWDGLRQQGREGIPLTHSMKTSTLLQRALYLHGEDIPEDIIELLTCKETIDCRNKDGATALFTAINRHCWKAVLLLIRLGADVDNGLNEKKTYLCEALCHKEVPLEVIRELATPQTINHLHFDDLSPLHMAIVFRRWDLADFLADYGADLNIRNVRGNTPLHFLCCYHNDISPDSVEKFISAENLNIKDRHGNTPLAVALQIHGWQKVKDVAELLLQKGTEFSICDIVRVLTNNYQKGSVEFLLQHLPQISNLYHMEFVFDMTYDKLRQLELNYKEIDFPLYEGSDIFAVTDIICILLLNTCFVKSQTYDKISEEDAQIAPVKYCNDKERDFVDYSRNPASLLRICLLNVRNYLCKTTNDVFENLGLPRNLVYSLKFKDVAHEIDSIWTKANVTHHKSLPALHNLYFSSFIL